MTSANGRPRGGIVTVRVLGILLGASVAHAAVPTIISNIGVVPDKLLVVDMPYRAGTAKVTFAAKDAAITNGRAGDVEGIRARLHVAYGNGATAGTFVVPAGTANGWVRNDSVMTRYFNRNAPKGPTKMRSIVLRPSHLLTVRGAGRGDIPLHVTRAGPPTGSIYVSFEIVEDGVTTRLCSEVQHCEYRRFENGAGTALRCLGGVADPGCRAAQPVYVSGHEARYGGPQTVAVIGDSITVQSTGALEEALADRWFTYVRAKSGSMFRELEPAAEMIGESNPQVVVIHLGTNDLACVLQNTLLPDPSCRFPDFTSDALLDDARTMVASVSGACVIGTTIWFGNAVGQLWYDMLAAGELAGVVPWEEYLSSLSAEERDRLLRDGLGHLTPAGTAALAELTAQVVAESCGPSLRDVTRGDQLASHHPAVVLDRQVRR